MNALTMVSPDLRIDTGPPIAQEAVAILPGETAASLLERVHAVEHRLLPEVVRRLLASL